MKNQDTPQEWAKEYQDFVSIEAVSPPKYVTERIFARVHSDFNPSFQKLFAKLALIQLITGSMSLLLCPQFGIQIWDGMGLMSLFMHLGDEACMLACGAVFLGTSALVSSLVLRPEEIKAIRKKEVLQLAALSFLSLAAFICLGAAAIGTLALFWFLGSVLGGLATMELGWMFRTLVLKH